MQSNVRQFKELDNIRRQLGMSCAAVARRAGVSLITVHRVMSGGHEAASLSTLRAIANALGVDVAIAMPASMDSPEALRQQQAWTKAEQLVKMAQATAGLESQGVSEPALRDAVRRTAAELLAGPKRKLWAK
jgi:transcriptional regulator with XRE-family HTH domain